MTPVVRLHALWAELEALGAAVDRRPLAGLTSAEIGALAAGEAERLRVLRSPEAADHVLWHERGAA